MFSELDICNIAMQIEKNGEEMYRRAAGSAVNKEMAAILNRLADEEKGHGQWFSEIKSKLALTEAQRELEQVGSSILQAMVEGKTFSLEQDDLDGLSSIKELFQLAKRFENDTILFYEMLGGLIEDESTKAHLQKIIEQERLHCKKLENIFALLQESKEENAMA